MDDLQNLDLDLHVIRKQHGTVSELVYGHKDD